MTHSAIPVIDLHCDLLGCIEFNRGKYDFESPETNCSLPQLFLGNVKLQVLAIAAMTQRDSSRVGRAQVELYRDLQRRPQVGFSQEFSTCSPKTHFLFGIENASAILDEEEDLDLFFERFEQYRSVEEILYLSLTWNQENRFGGGNLTKVGLKKEGETVLEYLDGKNVAIDLSHTSDPLAYDILDLIEKKSLKIPVIASHSNYRSVQDVERNLPDDIAKEIICQNGLIGLNFVHRFVGKTAREFANHIEHGLSLSGENAICLGADFYGGLDISQELCPGRNPTPFFEDFPNAGSYPQFIELLKERFSEDLIHKICYQNIEKFLKEHIGLFRRLP